MRWGNFQTAQREQAFCVQNEHLVINVRLILTHLKVTRIDKYGLF